MEFNFNKLLDKIKEFKDGIDYNFTSREIINQKEFNKVDEYLINSSQLKKESRKLVLNSDAENGGFYQVGREANGKWYEYKKGDGDQPDEFTIKEVSPEEQQKRKKEREEAKKKFERDKEEFERRRKNGEKPTKIDELTIKKCAFCGKEIDPSKGIISMGQTSKEEGRLYFCATDKCLEKRAKQKENQENNNKEPKCDNCGSDTSDEYGNFEYLTFDNKTYCYSCSEKLPKKSELKQEETKLSDLKSKLQNSSNPKERERLQQLIDNAESHIKDLEENQNNSNQPKNSLKESHGKYFLVGAVIFSVVILISVLVIRKRKKISKKQG